MKRAAAAVMIPVGFGVQRKGPTCSAEKSMESLKACCSRERKQAFWLPMCGPCLVMAPKLNLLFVGPLGNYERNYCCVAFTTGKQDNALPASFLSRHLSSPLGVYDASCTEHADGHVQSEERKLDKQHESLMPSDFPTPHTP